MDADSRFESHHDRLARIDKTGADAAEFRISIEGSREVREPVMGDAHKWGMIHDLYRAGWSYRLIAQFCGETNDEVRRWLTYPPPA